MDHPPRPARERLVTRPLAARILLVIALMVAAAFLVFNWELARGGSLEAARTATVNTIVACELFYLYNVRHFTEHAFRRETLAGNRAALLVGAILVVLQLLFTYAGWMQQAFRSVALDAASWAAILGAGALVFLAVEAEKALWRRVGVHRL
jgi:magnesium-transporting ATPase (P-type)